ncbi:hypothetical protein [Providencia huaxiensis]|uniref:hypothetical protein n=1 Tax=Providencia huaxiensis TaxID=2027290 RepID=UPI0034E53E3C
MENIQSKNNYKVLSCSFIFLIMSIFPSLVYVLAGVGSLGVGYLISISITFLILILFCGKFYYINVVLSIIILTLIFIFSVDSFLIEPGKMSGSVLSLSLIMLSANMMAIYLCDMTDIEIDNAIFITIITLLGFGIFGVIFKLNFLGYEYFPKSIFIFYEPSHYAITIGPIFVSSLLILKKYRLFISFSLLFISLSSQNLTMLIYWALGTWVAIENTKIKAAFLISVTVILIFIYSYSSSSLDYYTERINISQDSNNLSMLVYLQGWDEMKKSFFDSYGFGLGFQQAGSNTPGVIAEKIYEISNIYKNRQDAGFLSAKIIIEFGFLGIIFTLLFLKMFISSVKSAKNSGNNADKLICGIIISLFVEIFFRGQGYFTLGFYLLIVSINYKVIKSKVVL